jgi:N-acetylmuramoyl-L-alanine amidase
MRASGRRSKRAFDTCDGFPYDEFMIDPSTALRAAHRLILLAALIVASLLDRPAGAAQGAPTCKPEKFKIAIDSGHTFEATGTTSARGVPEHEYNLQLAKRIERTLVDGGFSRTTLITVQGLGRAQLMKRAERANALGVDLFLSIHHDDVQNFYHEKWIYSGATHLFSDRFSGYSLFVSRKNRHYEDSLIFAKLLGAALMGHGMRYSSHHTEAIPGEGRQLLDRQVGVYLYDQLVVLKSTEATAVLLEAGIIVNRVEELVLSSPEGRVSISAAVLEAVNQFCSQRQRP